MSASPCTTMISLSMLSGLYVRYEEYIRDCKQYSSLSFDYMQGTSSESTPATIPLKLPDGSVLEAWLDTDIGIYKVECDRCGTVISLTSHANSYSIVKHRSHGKCSKAQKKKERLQQMHTDAAIRDSIGSTAGGSPSPHAALTIRPSLSHLRITDTPTPSSSRKSTPMSPSNSPATPTTAGLSRHSTSGGVVAADDFWSSASGPSRGSGTPKIPSRAQSQVPVTFQAFVPPVSPETPVISPVSRVECRGVLVEWTAGSVWSTYPYHRHSTHDYPWEPVTWENNQWLRVRSDDCLGFVATGEDVCWRCNAVPQLKKFTDMVKRANEAAPHTQWTGLTFRQIHAALQKISGRYRQLQLKV